MRRRRLEGQRERGREGNRGEQRVSDSYLCLERFHLHEGQIHVGKMERGCGREEFGEKAIGGREGCG